MSDRGGGEDEMKPTASFCTKSILHAVAVSDVFSSNANGKSNSSASRVLALKVVAMLLLLRYCCLSLIL